MILFQLFTLIVTAALNSGCSSDSLQVNASNPGEISSQDPGSSEPPVPESLACLSEPWVTTDSGIAGVANGVVTTATGLLAAGMDHSNPNQTTAYGARKLSAGATLWEPKFHGVDAPGKLAYFNGIARSTVHNSLYAVGATGAGSQSGQYWIVKKSNDEGQTWQTVDIYSHNPQAATQFNYAKKVAIDSRGFIYVVGQAQSSNGLWLTRMSRDEGQTWLNADAFEISAGDGSLASSVFADKIGNVYVSGYASIAGGISKWVVRRSQDGGFSWKTIDEFNYGTGSSMARATYVTTSGVFIAVGYGMKNGKLRWIVRRSFDQGKTWKTVHDYQHADGKDSIAMDIFALPKGDVLVAGSVQNEDQSRSWLLFHSPDWGDSWKVIDNFQLETGSNATPSGLHFDPSSGVYAYGAARIGVQNLWTVRKLNCF